MGLIEGYLKDRVTELMGHGSTELTKSLCRLVRIFAAQPLIGVEIIHFILASRTYSLEDVRDPWDGRSNISTRYKAQELCLGILAEDRSAVQEFEAAIKKFLERNQALRDRRKPH